MATVTDPYLQIPFVVSGDVIPPFVDVFYGFYSIPPYAGYGVNVQRVTCPYMDTFFDNIISNQQNVVCDTFLLKNILRQFNILYAFYNHQPYTDYKTISSLALPLKLIDGTQTMVYGHDTDDENNSWGMASIDNYNEAIPLFKSWFEQLRLKHLQNHDAGFIFEEIDPIISPLPPFQPVSHKAYYYTAGPDQIADPNLLYYHPKLRYDITDRYVYFMGFPNMMDNLPPPTGDIESVDINWYKESQYQYTLLSILGVYDMLNYLGHRYYMYADPV